MAGMKEAPIALVENPEIQLSSTPISNGGIEEEERFISERCLKTSEDEESLHNGETDKRMPPHFGLRRVCVDQITTLEKKHEQLHVFLKNNRPALVRLGLLLVAVLWTVYLVYVIYYSGLGAVPLIVLTLLTALFASWSFLKRLLGRTLKSPLSQCCHKVCTERVRKWTRRFSLTIVVLAVISFVALDTSRDKENLTSLAGLLVLLLIVFLTSTQPFKVRWRPVLWGLGLQFILALLILRWNAGYLAFKFAGDQVKVFLEYTDAGSKFVFGPKTYLLHPIAFKVLPSVVFFSSIISILYHWGVIQWVVEGLAWILQFTMETTAVESFAAAAHVFVGQLESSVMLKPFLAKLTQSELHAVLATGFATIAGTVVAAYIEFGAPAEHVLAASFMSAPAALALAKISYPETETSTTKSKEDVTLPKGEERNVMEAASVGAANASKLLAYIIVNIIAFLSILEFVNAILAYLGAKAGVDNLSFQLICSYVFMPLAAIMGIPWEDTGKIGSLIGTKIFINEFVGYAQLGPMMENGEIQPRSGVIATYILCGFGSLQSMGINLGVFSAVAPSRRRDVAGCVLRAMIIGNIACFMTACIAGMLYSDPGAIMELDRDNVTSALNSTTNSGT